MSRKTPTRKRTAKREPTPKEEGQQILADAATAGTNYANDQVGGDYFRDWVWDQLVEGEEMRQRDPDSVIPLETPSDAKKLARNMLQQLEWDTKRDMETHTILELSGAKGVFDSGSADWVRDHYGITYEEVLDAFFSAFDEALERQRQWVTDMILENLDEVRGTPKSKLAHERPMVRAISPARHLANDIVRAIMKEPGILPYSLATRFGLEGRVASEILDLAPSSFGPGGEGFESYAKKVEKIILRKRVIRDVPRRPVVRDYVAVDHRDRVIAGPFHDYGDAKAAADRARGYVRFASGRVPRVSAPRLRRR